MKLISQSCLPKQCQQIAGLRRTTSDGSRPFLSSTGTSRNVKALCRVRDSRHGLHVLVHGSRLHLRQAPLQPQEPAQLNHRPPCPCPPKAVAVCSIAALAAAYVTAGAGAAYSSTEAKRFARQYRYEPSPEFPLTLVSSGIVQHLSGSNIYILTKTTLKIVAGCKCTYPCIRFHCAWQVLHPKTCTHTR